MKKEEKERVKKAIERYEYYSNYLHRINGASVRITNLRNVKGAYCYTGTLIYSERGEKSVYHDCYMDKDYAWGIIAEYGY